MYPLTQEECAVGAILDLVLAALRSHPADYPPLEDMKEYCRQACKIVAVFRKPPSENGNGITPDWTVSPRIRTSLVLTRKSGERIVIDGSVAAEAGKR